MLRENYHELKCDKLVSRKYPLTSWLKCDTLVSKKYPLKSWKRKKRAPGPCRTESAVLDWITKPSYVYPLRIQMILRTQFIGSGAFANGRPAEKEGSSSYTTPSVYMYLYSNFPECRLHSCVEQKAVSLLVTLTVSGSFIIKFLTCRRRSCFMFMVSSRYVLSRRRKENVCLQWHAQLVANSILWHAEHLSKARFCKRNLWSWASRDFEEKQLLQLIAIFFIIELNGPEWMGMLCMNQRKVQTILGGPKRMRLWRSVP